MLSSFNTRPSKLVFLAVVYDKSTDVTTCFVLVSMWQIKLSLSFESKFVIHPGVTILFFKATMWQIKLSLSFESKFVIHPGVSIHTGRSVNGKESIFWRKTCYATDRAKHGNELVIFDCGIGIELSLHKFLQYVSRRFTKSSCYQVRFSLNKCGKRDGTQTGVQSPQPYCLDHIFLTLSKIPKICQNLLFLNF